MSALLLDTAPGPASAENEARTCFHCLQAIPAGLELSVRLDEVDRPVCCQGCKAVAEMIIDSSQADYYSRRPIAVQPQIPHLPENPERWLAQRDYPLQPIDANHFESTVIVDGLHCGACVWLIERQLEALPGVHSVQGDLASARFSMTVASAAHQTLALGQILKLGYSPYPDSREETMALQRQEWHTALKRLGVAGLGMMQVMMFAAGHYFDSDGSMSADHRRVLELCAMLVTTPVLLYAGRGFLDGAWRALSAGSLNMDVPVALALTLTYLSSVINVFRDSGPVWFESVTMFCFFLLFGRTLELMVRHRVQGSADALLRLLPDRVCCEQDGQLLTIARAAVTPGMVIRVDRGARIPADGALLSDLACVDESLISGESGLIRRQRGEAMITGSLNLQASIRLQVTAVDSDSFVASLAAALPTRRARQRPRGRLEQTAERLASLLIAAVLILSLLAGLVWLSIDANRAWPIALSILVVACPCALSLSVPMALAAASRRAQSLGLLLVRSDVLMDLDAIAEVQLDKTGTLTTMGPTIRRMSLCQPPRLDSARCLEIAAALESLSTHPLARAFSAHHTGLIPEHFETDDHGISGFVEGRRYRIGQAADSGLDAQVFGSLIELEDDQGMLARFELAHQLRDGAGAMIESLRKRHLEVRLLSGDGEQAVRAVAEPLGIAHWRARQTPQQKQAAIARSQAAGQPVMMVGDGINDALVLSEARVSVAIAEGSGLAHSCADVILTGADLTPIAALMALGDRTRRVIRQNLIWALAWNLSAIPAAMAGWISPWMAALGMSLSSLLVTLNAARLMR